MGSKYIISADIGTTYVKTGLYDTGGICICTLQEKVPQKYVDNGALEQNGDDFVSLFLKTVKSLILESSINPRDVMVIVFTGQMAGAIGIDKKWNAVTIWSGTMDIRQNKMLEGKLDNRRILSLSGTNLPFMGKKIKWFENEYKSDIGNIVKYVGLSSYVIGKISGIKTDDAFLGNTYLTWTGLADIKNEKWSDELCCMFQISSKKLPGIVDSKTIVGKLSKSTASLCGLVEGIPIVAGAGDKIAGCIGAGAVEPGIIVDECGSISALSLCTDIYNPDVKNLTLETLPSAIPGQYFYLFFIPGSGLVMSWFIDNFAQELKKPDDGLMGLKNEGQIFKLLDKEAQKISAGSNNLLCVGLLGGRALPFEPDIRGMWIGHSLIHTKIHFYRSLLESYAYEYRHCLEIMKEISTEIKFSSVRVIGGGGSTSDLWNTIKANVLAVPYNQLKRKDCALLGTAILGGYGTGIFESVEKTAIKFASIKKTYNVDISQSLKYLHFANIYLKAIKANKRIFNQLSTGS